MSKLDGPFGRNPFADSSTTPGPLGHNELGLGDTPGTLGIGDWADPTIPKTRGVLLACAGSALPLSSEPPPGEYAPDLSTSKITVEALDGYFARPKGPLLKSRIAAAAKEVGLNPGLLAASMLSEDRVTQYTATSGEVSGFDIGVDDYKEREAKFKKEFPSAKTVKPTRYETHTNEKGRVIEVPVFKAEDAVRVSAYYLKDSELKARAAIAEMGGSFDRLPVEYRFAITRYAMNAGPQAARKIMEQFLGLKKGRHGTYVPSSKRPKELLRYKPWRTIRGMEQFYAREGFALRAATAHAAQAIHLSQRIFGVNPLSADDSLLFVR